MLAGMIALGFDGNASPNPQMIQWILTLDLDDPDQALATAIATRLARWGIRTATQLASMAKIEFENTLMASCTGHPPLSL